MDKKLSMNFLSFKKNGILLVFILICIVLSIITPGFLSWENIRNILRQSSIIGLMAIGTTYVIVGGGFDISVGSVLCLAGALTVGLQQYMHWSFAILLSLLAGVVIGLLNGFLVSKIRIPSIIATLGTMTVVRGLVYLYTGGYPAVADSLDFSFLGNGYLGPMPIPIIIFLGMVGFWQFTLARTKLGRYISAIGGNKEAARLSGVRVDYYQILSFVIGGLMAAMAGVIYASRILSVTPVAGEGNELDAIAAAVIGGTSVSGGEGSIVRTLIGVLLLNIIVNVFNLLEIYVYFQYVIKGAIIILAVGFDTYSKSTE